MRQVVVVAAVLAFVLGGLAAVAQQEGFSLSGRLGATDQEAQEGYFAIDSETMIVVRPESSVHQYLRARVGQRVRITIVPEGGSE
jgi:hypothetical protein